MIKAIIKQLFGGGEAALRGEQQSAELSRVAHLQRQLAAHPSKGLTPDRLYQILEAAERGDLTAQHELYDDMEEKDSQIGSDMGKRRSLAAELEWQITPPSGADANERKASDFCAEAFSGLAVETLISDLGSGVGHGWAMLEQAWELHEGKQRVLQPIHRPHAWFRLNPDDQDDLRLRDLSASGAELWPLGWAQHRHRARPGYVARSGLHRVLVWPYLFQNYALGDLAQLLEIYGIPARLGKYPPNSQPHEKATLLRAVTSLGSNAAGIIPEGMSIEFLQAANGKGEIFEVMLKWCERAKAKAILGSTLTSGTGEGTNTNALGNVHERSQQALIRHDARQYAATIMRDMIYPMAAINYGVTSFRRVPRFYLDTGEPEDYRLLAESLPVFVDMGAKIPMWWLHERIRIPIGEPGEDLLQRPAGDTLLSPGGVRPAALRQPAHGQHLAAARSADLATEQATDPETRILPSLEQAGAEELVGWVSQIREVVRTAPDLPALKAALGTMRLKGTEEMGDTLATAFALADAQGRESVAMETGQLDGEQGDEK